MNERTLRIEEIERELWLMEFADRWTLADWAHRAELQRELENLRNN
jgi:predicted DNA-binding transcriptional regulator